MTPFSETLERYRRRSQLNQCALAKKIGVASSYISILERSHKPPPSQDVLNKIIGALALTDCEAATLRYDAKISNYCLSVPNHSKRSTYELVYKMQNKIGCLSDMETKILNAIFATDKQQGTIKSGDEIMN